MNNPKQTYQKSIATEITGTSIHQARDKRHSLNTKRYSNKSISQKLIQYNLIPNFRGSQTKSRQRIVSKRYTTLTPNQQSYKRQTKKSKSFSNQIYFPNTKIYSINQQKQQKQQKIFIKINKKAKTQNGTLDSVNRASEDMHKNNNSRDHAIKLKNQTQNVQPTNQMSFLSKLNIEKRNKIMEIYRPKENGFARSKKKINVKTSNQKEIDNSNIQSQHQIIQHKIINRQSQKKIISNGQNQPQSTAQIDNSYNAIQSSVNNKIAHSQISASYLQLTQNIQNSQIKKSATPITHIIIDSKVSLSNQSQSNKIKFNKNKPDKSQFLLFNPNNSYKRSQQKYKHNQQNSGLIDQTRNQIINTFTSKTSQNVKFKQISTQKKKQQAISQLNLAYLQNRQQKTGKNVNAGSKSVNTYSQFKLPKYTQFYDNYISQEKLLTADNMKQQMNNQIKPELNQKYQNKYQKSHQSFNTHPNQNISLSTASLMKKSYSPMISCAKISLITPQQIDQPCPNSAKNQQQQTFQQQSQVLMYEKQKQSKLIHDFKQKTEFPNYKNHRYTPKIQSINRIIMNENLLGLQNFRIIKIGKQTYFGEINQKQQPHGLGIIFYKSGKLFQGEFLNGYKSGEGYEIFPDGSLFCGHYRNNLKNGKGRFEWSNGQIYDGQWLNEKKHGSGQWKAGNSISYAGQWKDNRIQGFGVLVEGQQRYEGQFLNFAKHGHGTYRYQNGQIYTGQFRNNRLNGRGQYYWPNGDHYKGEFINNRRHGKGNLFLHKLNILYRGQFRNDKKCGLGQETYSQQIKYYGNFQNDLKHGWGILKRIYPSNKASYSINTQQQLTEQIIYQGYWINNQTIQMSDTPLHQFEMIQQQEAQYLKNQLSKSNVKVKAQNRYDNKNSSPQKSRQIGKTSLNKNLLKPKQSVSIKGRSRYMRINNHYIKKSMQHDVSQKSIQKLRSSQKSPYSKVPRYGKREQ